MTNSAGPDQLASSTQIYPVFANGVDPVQLASDLDLHCLQRQGISGYSRREKARPGIYV